MEKVIVIPSGNDVYAEELRHVVKSAPPGVTCIPETDLTTDYLIDHHIDVVIGNRLSDRWYDRLRHLQIVSLAIGPLNELHPKCDIVVDCAEPVNNKYFTGPEYSTCNGDFDLLEVANLVHLLDFDTKFFGFPVAYITSKYLTESIAFRINRFVAEQKVTLVEYLCNCHDDVSVRIAERNLFHFTDIRMSLSRPIADCRDPELPAGIEYRKACTGDIPRLRELGAGLYRDSRYFFDGNFEVDRINEFYQSWIEKGIRGTFDDFCGCLFADGQLVGFCTVRYQTSRMGRIGVFGIAPQSQGRGLGPLLIQKVLHRAEHDGIKHMQVVTQGRNYPAQKLYQGTGFRVHRNELWYHKWIK